MGRNDKKMKAGGVGLEGEYNRICGKILRRERKERQISLDALACGLLSRQALRDVEGGRAGWTKMTGDILMHRMGVSTEYFEVITSSEELDRWRLREDICLLVWERPAAAAGEIHKYRKKYQKREPVEEQFLMKAEVVLLLREWWQARGGPDRAKEAGKAQEPREVWDEWKVWEAVEGRKAQEDAEGETAREETEVSDGQKRQDAQEETNETGEGLLKKRILEKAGQAVACTVRVGWERGIQNLWLAPAELEALLLTAAALALCGEDERAFALQQSVWNYPKARQWTERMKALILPQAALLGMGLAMRKNRVQEAFETGKEALELLRCSFSHCYVLPLLDCLCGIPVRDEEGRLYLEQAEGFRKTFKDIYRRFDYPEYRIWQGFSVDNTRDVGIVLKMLRKFHGKSCENAVYDGEELIITPRQLKKIERGEHKPSYANYQRLVAQYRKDGGWKTAMLETDSMDVLELRQQIATLIGFGRWSEAESEIEKLRMRVNTDYPRTKQEFLFFKALFLWEKEGLLEKSLLMMQQALHVTMPDMDGVDMKWWGFQREEIMIASNIANLYRRLGRMEEAGKWFEAVKASLELQREKTGVPHNGYGILMDGYDNFLGDKGCVDAAMQMNERAISDYLKWPQIRLMASMLYRLAWNSYEKADKEEEFFDELHPKWKVAFQLSLSLADYINDSKLKDFLDSRREKYLF